MLAFAACSIVDAPGMMTQHFCQMIGGGGCSAKLCEVPVFQIERRGDDEALKLHPRGGQG